MGWAPNHERPANQTQTTGKHPPTGKARRYLQMYYGNTLDFNSSVPLDSNPKARAKKIHRLSRGNRDLGRIFSDIYSCVEQDKHWDKLSPYEHILLESRWTDLMLMLLSIGNARVMRSIRYRLREQTAEEDELEEGEDN